MMKIWEDKVTIDCWEYQRTSDYRNCNPAWAKMVDSIDEDLEHGDYEKTVNTILKKYKAKMIRPRTQPHYMRFPNEKMACWFLLEWS
jgi:hypothetical protein